ncbi:MAG: GntR family transcriptional regulator, partial [Planctomycetota bacterium]
MIEQEKQKLSRRGITGKRPLYRAVADALREQLVNGKLNPGTKLPTIRALAKQYNVSVITISKALRKLENEGRLTCIPAVGAFVKIPRTDRENGNTLPQISFFTIEIGGDPFTDHIAAGIEKTCQERGWTLQIHSAQADPKIEAENLAHFNKFGSKGAIILPVADDRNLEALFRLKISNFPYVLVDQPFRGLNVNAVLSDHEKGAYLATQNLIQHGHRRVFVTTYAYGLLYTVDARIRGYERALIEHGIKPRPEWKIVNAPYADALNILDGDPLKSWYELLVPVLKKAEKPMAIFALNSGIARSLLEACRDLGLGIPQDVSIVSFDDTELMQAYNPPITVIAQRTEHIGQTAVELLEHHLQSGDKCEPQQVLIDVDLIERGS